MSNKYITTTLPYVNSDPHIGFALEIVQADVWARAQKLIGNTVIFNTGTDEHGAKIYEKAKEQGKEPQKFVDEYASKFDNLKSALHLCYTNFIRTTAPHHKQAAQEFWKRCDRNGDIYKKNYKIKYCVGCELEKTDSELKDGCCPLHPNREIDYIEEKNYFFRFSKYQKQLLKLYDEQPDFVQPAHRLAEIRNFVKSGLEDFSISRLKNKMPWGVPVPSDDEQVMYVWFDALINYISTLGWPYDEKKFSDFWPGIQVAGKDNLRQQSAMWQAMLISARLPPSKHIFIHGFISMNGQKISKSTGNVVDPFELVKKYGTDAVRYYLLREIPTLDDGDFSYDRMEQLYDADLANELGNLVSRVTTLAAKDGIVQHEPVTVFLQNKIYIKLIEQFNFSYVLEDIWNTIKTTNKLINDTAPWKLEKAVREKLLKTWLTQLQNLAINLSPFLPETSEKIISATSGTIKKIQPLFPRLSK
ncbi:MAG: Methionine-tRNA ligase [Candidatus Roizmanbacteria bacterium GW2011_GWA2_37_7]|uniref:Methionine--tRNA ligase n=1 Tax=Candidatus Roizmanbacteria bacterium GW2011_GWA2_37_7 TaxID=1618481 RepID=A0A0G0H696_9BACT|nr:MAG: Methionine-tRNA ligase [Candidatus Roizmanbacteria bacterium GW2011_GWA2_37_7]